MGLLVWLICWLLVGCLFGGCLYLIHVWVVACLGCGWCCLTVWFGGFGWCTVDLGLVGLIWCGWRLDVGL